MNSHRKMNKIEFSLIEWMYAIDIFAVVTKQNGFYRLSLYCDETVPPFGPTLPNPPDFQVKIQLKHLSSREHILGDVGSKVYPNGNVSKSKEIQVKAILNNM